MELSIVIVNWNVSELLEACLNSVYKYLNGRKLNFEIVVVDNASIDNSVEMLKEKFPKVILLQNVENVGFGRGCNKGFRSTSGEFVLMLNPDTVITGTDIEVLLNKIREDKTLGLIGPRMMNENGIYRRDSGGYFPTLKNIMCHYLLLNYIIPNFMKPLPCFLENDPQGTFDIEWVSGAGMMLRREAIVDPVFDEDYFMFGEDMDLCFRFLKRGWRVAYTSDATIVHHHGQSYAKQSSVTVLQMVHKGPRLFFEKNNSPWKLRLYDSILIVGYFLRWWLYLFADVVFPNKGYGKLSQFSRQFLTLMIPKLTGKR